MKTAEEFADMVCRVAYDADRTGPETLVAIAALFREYGQEIAVAQRSADAFAAMTEAAKSMDSSTAAVVQQAVWDTPIVMTP